MKKPLCILLVCLSLTGYAQTPEVNIGEYLYPYIVNIPGTITIRPILSHPTEISVEYVLIRRNPTVLDCKTE